MTTRIKPDEVKSVLEELQYNTPEYRTIIKHYKRKSKEGKTYLQIYPNIIKNTKNLLIKDGLEVHSFSSTSKCSCNMGYLGYCTCKFTIIKWGDYDMSRYQQDYKEIDV